MHTKLRDYEALFEAFGFCSRNNGVCLRQNVEYILFLFGFQSFPLPYGIERVALVSADGLAAVSITMPFSNRFNSG